MKPTLRYGSFLMAVALVAAACGGGDSSDTVPAPEATIATSPPTSDITATAKDFLFSPNAWTAGAESEVTFEFENQGSVTHTWIILSSPIESESEFSEDLIVFETSAEAGEAATITFTAPAAGTYQVICNVPGHFSLGMEGLLTVTGA